MSRWEVVISCWVVELFDCSAEFSSNVWSIQIRNESSPRQQSEFFGCLAENIRLSWFIQKNNESSRRQRPVQTVDDNYFRPYRGLTEQSIYSESIFIWQTRVLSVEIYSCICWNCACFSGQGFTGIVGRSTWLFLPGKSKQANKDY